MGCFGEHFGANFDQCAVGGAGGYGHQSAMKQVLAPQIPKKKPVWLIENLAKCSIVTFTRGGAKSKILLEVDQYAEAARELITSFSTGLARSKISLEVVGSKITYRMFYNKFNKRLEHLKVLELLDMVDAVDGGKFIMEKNTPSFENTITSRKTRECEQELQGKLARFSNLMKNRIDKGNSLDAMRQEFGPQVLDAISKCIRDVYFAGFNYVEKVTKRTQQLTTFDINNITALINQEQDKFWQSVSDYTSKRTFTPEEEDVPGHDLTNTFAGISASLATMALYSATQSATIAANNQSAQLLSQINFGVEIEEPHTYQLIWVTERDSKVCPICQNLDGRTFDTRDPDIQRPGNDTHVNCRCRLLLVDTKTRQIFNG